MPKHTLRSRLNFLRQEQFELECQLYDLKRAGISSFSLRRASDLIRQWLTLNKYWRSALAKKMGWSPAAGSLRGTARPPAATPGKRAVRKAPYADGPQNIG